MGFEYEYGKNKDKYKKTTHYIVPVIVYFAYFFTKKEKEYPLLLHNTDVRFFSLYGV